MLAAPYLLFSLVTGSISTHQYTIIPVGNIKMPPLQMSSELKQARIIAGFLLIYTTILCLVLNSQGRHIWAWPSLKVFFQFKVFGIIVF